MRTKSSDKGSAEVYAGTIWKATMIKQMLIENDLPAFIQNEYTSTASPYTSGYSSLIKVFVSAEHFDKAMAYIKEFENNYEEE